MDGCLRRERSRGLVRMLRRKLGIWVPPLLLTFSGLVSAGDCVPDNGARRFEFPFSATFTSPEDNAPRRVLPDAHRWDLGQYYTGICTCSRRNVTYAAPFVYSTRTNLPAGHSAMVDGKTLQFYQVNRNIQVASHVFVAGNRG